MHIVGLSPILLLEPVETFHLDTCPSTLASLLDCTLVRIRGYPLQMATVATTDTKGGEAERSALRQRLEQQLHAELNLASVVRGENPAETRRAKENIRQAEVRRVHDVEELGAKLQRGSFAERRIFEERNVHVPQRRPANDVPSRVPKRPERGKSERFGVEPALRIGVRQHGIAGDVRAVPRPESQIGDTRVAVIELARQRHRKRLTGLKHHDTVYLPTADQRTAPTAGQGANLASAAER